MVNQRKSTTAVTILLVAAVVGAGWYGLADRPSPSTGSDSSEPDAAPLRRSDSRAATTANRSATKFFDEAVQPCQALGPAAPNDIWGIDCFSGSCGEKRWDAMGPIPWQAFAQGEYVGHARTEHVPVYRLRVDDRLEIVYRLTREETTKPYELNIGDRVRVESFTDDRLNRDLVVQPDGTVTLRLLNQVRAAGRTIEQLREFIEERYKKYYKVPAISIVPQQLNTQLEDLRATVDARAGTGGQRIAVRVTPEGTIQLPALGSVYVQGLTLDEVKREIDERYAATIEGVAVTPVLSERAPRFIYVVGEVNQPGRFVMEGPTTVIQAIALAGSWRVGANLRQVVVFRRGDDWRLMATLLDIRGALYGKRPCPADEIWLNDSDIVVVPKQPITWANEIIEQVFTRGVYGVVPFSGVTVNFSKLSTI